MEELSLEEGNNNREDYSLSMKYEQILSIVVGRELSLYILLAIDDNDSSETIYQYDEASISAGIRYNLFY